MTSAEYDAEPLDELIVNQHIMRLQSDLEEEKTKEMERKSKAQ